MVDFAPGKTLGMWSTFWKYHDDEQNKKKVTLIRAVSAGFPKDQKQRDVLVRLAVAPWQPYEEIDLKRANPGEKSGNGSVQFRQVQERTDGTTQVDLAFPANFELRANHEVVGEDRDGNKVVLSGTTIVDAGARGWFFPCPLDRLVRVRVRFRWYTHEVTFRDVSLRPGHLTKVKAKVTKLDPPPDVSLDVFAPVDDAAYARPTADEQRATAKIPADAWGKPVDGLRAAIVLRSPPIDKDERLCYDIVAENVSDHDIRFAAEVGIDTWHFYFDSKLVDTDGKQVAQKVSQFTRLGAKLTRFWLKPNERAVMFSWASRLFTLDEEGNPLARPEEYRGPSWFSSFSVKPGRYSLSAAVQLGPGWSSVDPISKKRTVLSPAPGEWSGKLQTGAVPVELFTQPEPADEGVARHPPLEFRIAASKADRKADPVAWFPIKIMEPRRPLPAEESGANLPIEEQLDDQWRGLLWDKAEHALLSDGTWRVVKCEVIQSKQSTDLAPSFEIQITLDAAGGASLRRLTATHLNQPLAIVVDGTIVAAPVLRSEFGEEFVITGTFSKAVAEKLAAAIRKPDLRKRATLHLRFVEAKSALAALKDEADRRKICGFEATIDPRLNAVTMIADADTLDALREILARLDSIDAVPIFRFEDPLKHPTSTVIEPADLGPEHDGKEVTMIFKITDTQLIGGEREGAFPHVKLHYDGMKKPPHLGVYVKGELADVLHRSACVSPDDKLVGRSIKATGKITMHKDFPKGEDQTPIYHLDLRDWKKFQILPEPKTQTRLPDEEKVPAIEKSLDRKNASSVDEAFVPGRDSATSIRIAGKCVDENGMPVEGATIELFSNATSSKSLKQTRSQPDGAFDLGEFPDPELLA
ncbi:MAG: SecDF P1 head subdomain-containing protein [Planctomycetales bacterium]